MASKQICILFSSLFSIVSDSSEYDEESTIETTADDSDISSSLEENRLSPTEEEQRLNILPSDPAFWPDHITERERVDFVKKGFTHIVDYDFPTDEVGKKFTISNYY